MTARQWKDAQGVHVDVRGLKPPEPFVAIVGLVESAPPGTVVIVHHERDPVLLHGELAALGWQAERIDGDPGEVRLRLTRER